MPALSEASSGYLLQRGAGPIVALWLIVFVIPFFFYVPDGSPPGGTWTSAARQIFAKDGKLNPLAALGGVVGYFKGLYRDFPDAVRQTVERRLSALWTGQSEVISNEGWGEPRFGDFRSYLEWKFKFNYNKRYE